MANQRKEFSKIYDEYIAKIYRFVYLKVSSEEIAQDLCSETFVKGWKTYKTQKIDNIQAFLYKIARNLVIDHYRRSGRVGFVPIEDVSIIDPSPSIEERVAISSDIDRVKVSLADLKEDYQNVIVWHYLDDLPISKVAKMLDKTEDATRVMLHRALKSLKNNIREA